MTIIKNVIILTDNNSELFFDGNIEITNCKCYNIESIKHYISYTSDKKGIFNRIMHFIVIILQKVANIIHGIESGYRMCCIMAYLTGCSFYIPEINQGLCYKCYKKMMKNK